ncbi:hypothetical protein G647_05351 [Cladophialophora carrionii CBS 160.54]|uniref:Uncharacterized protein n=1 Tax=Cladophialophora carrionii CBS 160.54 TaxID=1279043 RepID=V9D9F0_9EURO|nr:uncharacterized protein G647_05351 [Cladophialophora carrionii CBS 160.54]ETI23549.1 hypothetical protein G647_05351 [Cladophialophora carrionii CBS 160.54]
MEEISRWSPDSDELASCFPSRPSTPQSVRTLLRSPGSPLRTLGKKLSLTGLSVRSRNTSPGRGEATRLNQSHVAGEGGEGVANVLDTGCRPGYKPLSVAVGRPFHFDVNKALDIVQNSLSSTPHDITTSQDPVKRAIPASSTMKPRQDDEKTVKLARTFAMSSPDLSPPAAFNASSSPPEGADFGPNQDPKQRVITGDILDLNRLPPPDISQHPAHQESPFKSTSDAPLMVTTTSKEEIKRLVKEARQRFDDRERHLEREEAEQEEAARQGTVRFKSFPKRGNAFNIGYNNAVGAEASLRALEGGMTPKSATLDRHPIYSRKPQRVSSEPSHSFNLRSNFSRFQIDKDNDEADIYDILSESSPTTATTPHQAKSSIDSGKTPTTPASEGFEQKKTGLRKVTGMFGKHKPEKSQSELTPPIEVDMLHRPDLERYLRRSTNNHSYDYDPGQPYPRHPNTSRAWHSRNLKCTTCLEQCCAVCGRACCAYRAAALAMKIRKDNPESLKIAEERLLQIAFLFPYGQEAPTFLQCTKGDEVGCGKMVCPDCCGECPQPICKDIQCQKCKKDPWNDCLWHDEDMNRCAL